METRNKSPFPTSECKDDDCPNHVPDSSRTNYCCKCDNFKQIYGKDPSDVDETPTVNMHETRAFGAVVSWRVVCSIDGERKRDETFRSKKKAKRLRRMYEGALVALE